MSNTVAAAGETPSPWVPFLGVAVTGLLLGLGANPTHEVIKFIQEAKVGRREANGPSPEVQPPALPTVLMVSQQAPAGPLGRPGEQALGVTSLLPTSSRRPNCSGGACARGVNTLSLRRR